MKEDQADPVISEIREARHRISARFDHDSRRLVAYYVQKQGRHGDRLIERQPHAGKLDESEEAPKLTASGSR
jgi:hypothetical protein